MSSPEDRGIHRTQEDKWEEELKAAGWKPLAAHPRSATWIDPAPEDPQYPLLPGPGYAYEVMKQRKRDNTMSKPRTKAPQAGSIYEKHGAFHVRFYAYENGVRVQRSKKLCAASEVHPAKDHPSVLTLAEEFIRGLNTVNGENAADCGHKCPICHQRCKRTIRGNFAKKAN